MTTQNLKLAEIRQALDEIDGRIHELLIERSRFAPAVVAAKQGGPYWRPAREAQMLRRRQAAHHGDFPVRSLLRIWNEIIAGMVRIESNFRVALASIVPDLDLTIRDYFGLSVPVTRYAEARAALAEARATSDIVAILPWPAAEDPNPWWPQLLEKSKRGAAPLALQFRLPFVGHHTAPAALVSCIPSEPSGLDRSWLVVDKEAPLGDFGTDLVDLGCHEGWRLIDVPGFIAPGALQAGEGSPTALQGVSRSGFCIGAYAAPIDLAL